MSCGIMPSTWPSGVTATDEPKHQSNAAEPLEFSQCTEISQQPSKYARGWCSGEAIMVLLRAATPTAGLEFEI